MLVFDLHWHHYPYKASGWRVTLSSVFQITNNIKKMSDQSGLEFFDFYYIPICHNHSRYSYLAAVMAIRSLVGALS